ncbi:MULTISPECIES: phosphotransferase [Bacillaceae]|uniref:Phosphotransferase n=1 Tax=Evansella alkalicola TaxID=745819 RepID=A0ABS6JTS7_9BACI|nr:MULTISPECIES: phosphotransferase [Bacillaceae]MBU9721969.1 phosphotransferase [Bacillus alkalicola]
MESSPRLLKRFSKDLNHFYGITPVGIYEAPRGFAAETFFVDTEDHSYFLKIMHNPRRQNIFKNGLRVVDALVKSGIDYITRVVTLSTGELFFEKDGSVIALFKRIDAKQSYEYNREAVFRKLAHIYRTSMNIPERDSFMKEEFSDHFIKGYEENVQFILSHEVKGEEAQEVKDMLIPHKEFLKSCPETIKETIAKCQNEHADYYITHSDIIPNIMIAENGDHFIIDFDETIFAPLERDGFLTIAAKNEDSKLWLSIMREFFPGYEVNETFIKYYLYERFMIDLTSFIQDLLHNPDREYRVKVVNSTRDYLLGWLLPMMVKY